MREADLTKLEEMVIAKSMESFVTGSVLLLKFMHQRILKKVQIETEVAT